MGNVVQRLGLQPRNLFHRDDALGRGHVGEGHLAGNVTYGVDSGYVGSHCVIYLDAGVERRDSQGLESQVFHVGLDPNGHQDLFTLQTLFLPIPGYFYG